MSHNPRTPSPPVDYTSRDWLGFREFLLTVAQDKLPEWQSRKASDFGVVLVELFAYIGDVLSFYGDRIANEAFIQTAVQRQSVLNIAEMLNYTPSQGNAATVTLQFVIEDGATNDPSGDFIIPACTQVRTTDNVDDQPVYFELDEELVVDTDLTPGVDDTVEASATEGQQIQLEAIGVSDSLPNQTFILAQSPVIQGTIEIYVDEGAGFELWNKVDNLLEGGTNDAVYTTAVDSSGVISINFGDGRNGRVPLLGSQIKSTYRVGGGLRGNVAANTLTILVEPLDGVLSVTNPLAATGGADPETLNEIRVNAPRALSTIERAVTLADHGNLALRVSGIARATAVDQGVVDNTQEIDIPVKATGGGNASAGLKTEVETYVQDRTMINNVVTVVDATDVGIDMDVTVQVKDNYSNGRVKAAVEVALEELLAFERVDFNHRVTLSSLYGVIQSTAGVDYGVVDVLDVAAGTGLADVVLVDDEFPIVGTITVTANGGIEE